MTNKNPHIDAKGEYYSCGILSCEPLFKDFSVLLAKESKLEESYFCAMLDRVRGNPSALRIQQVIAEQSLVPHLRARDSLSHVSAARERAYERASFYELLAPRFFSDHRMKKMASGTVVQLFSNLLLLTLSSVVGRRFTPLGGERSERRKGRGREEDKNHLSPGISLRQRRRKAICAAAADFP